MLEQYHSLKCEEQFFSSNIINLVYIGLKYVENLTVDNNSSICFFLKIHNNKLQYSVAEMMFIPPKLLYVLNFTSIYLVQYL